MTWGSGLNDQLDLAYPARLRHEGSIGRSDNLAIRASSAVWPSQCLQSMIRDLPDDEVNYDVILLEFSLNGLMGLQLLVHRVRRRYPNALIIYIDLYSNRKPGFSNCIGGPCRMTPTRMTGLQNLLDRVGATMLQMPRPKDPLHWEDDVQPWFANDNHHLSATGHAWIVKGVMDIIGNFNFNTDHGQGDWLEGDLCVSWFKTGRMPPPLRVQGGTLNEFAKLKYAYEIPSHATLDFDASALKGPAPLFLVYMTKSDEYPQVSVNFNDQHFIQIDSKSPHHNFVDDHVTAVQSLGLVQVYEEIHLEIENIDLSKDKLPFRLVGIVMCAACRTFDPHFGERDCRQRACYDFVEDER